MDYFLAVGALILANAAHVVGFIMPLLVRVVNKDIKAERDRYIVSFFVCLFAATLLHWKEIAYGNPVLFAAFVGLIFTESNAMYKLYFSPRWKSGIGEKEDGVTPLVP